MYVQKVGWQRGLLQQLGKLSTLNGCVGSNPTPTTKINLCVRCWQSCLPKIHPRVREPVLGSWDGWYTVVYAYLP